MLAKDNTRTIYRRTAIDVAVLGEYRTNHATGLVANQAASSRLFELRNAGSNLLIPTQLNIRWLQTANHTAFILPAITVFKCTGFTAVDTVNTVTPTASSKRTSKFAAAPGGAVIRGLTSAGNSAGMTGGTLTKDGNSIGILAAAFLATLPTAGPVPYFEMYDNFADTFASTPFVLEPNEGITIENLGLMGAAGASSVFIDFSWVEVSAF